jgi:hypothetical protein
MVNEHHKKILDYRLQSLHFVLEFVKINNCMCNIKRYFIALFSGLLIFLYKNMLRIQLHINQRK